MNKTFKIILLNTSILDDKHMVSYSAYYMYNTVPISSFLKSYILPHLLQTPPQSQVSPSLSKITIILTVVILITTHVYILFLYMYVSINNG